MNSSKLLLRPVSWNILYTFIWLFRSIVITDFSKMSFTLIWWWWNTSVVVMKVRKSVCFFSTGFLMTLFTELSDHLHGSVNCDAASQTSSEDAHKESLGVSKIFMFSALFWWWCLCLWCVMKECDVCCSVEKMQMIEQEYELMRNREERWTSVEVKLTQHRREIEEQSQVELKAQVCLHHTWYTSLNTMWRFLKSIVYVLNWVHANGTQE